MDLYRCRLHVLQELPTSIGRLNMLTILNVDRNQLTDIPREVYDVANTVFS